MTEPTRASAASRPWPELSPGRAVELVAAHLPEPLREPLAPVGEGDFCVAYGSGAWIVRVRSIGKRRRRYGGRCAC